MIEPSRRQLVQSYKLKSRKSLHYNKSKAEQLLHRQISPTNANGKKMSMRRAHQNVQTDNRRADCALRLGSNMPKDTLTARVQQNKQKPVKLSRMML